MLDWGKCNDNGRCDFRKGGRLSAFDAVFHAVAGADIKPMDRFAKVGLSALQSSTKGRVYTKDKRN
jgi:putative cofactor-binding repeat protein